MPRKRAAERHAAIEPRPWPPPDEHALLDAIVAINHPVRRALYEALDGGVADVGTLAGRVGIAPGSASHHLGVLASAGWIEPAPEASADTRRSSWRSLRRSLSWSSNDLTSGTRGRRIADDLTVSSVNANHAVLLRALSDPAARPSSTLSDWHVRATDAQCEELNRRILATVAQWRDEVEVDTGHDPDRQHRPDERQPRRIVMWQAPIGDRR